MARHAMDCFYDDPAQPDGVKRSVSILHANSDQEAVAQACDHAVWNRPAYFKVWSVGPDGRSELLYDSRKTREGALA